MPYLEREKKKAREGEGGMEDATRKRALAWRNTVLRDFPMCREEVEAHHRCMVSAPSPTPPRPCRRSEAHVAWCVVASFCPPEAAALTSCLGGSRLDFTAPSPSSSPGGAPEEDEGEGGGGLMGEVPSRCMPAFKQFDRCLVRRTNSPHARDPLRQEAHHARRE